MIAKLNELFVKSGSLVLISVLSVVLVYSGCRATTTSSGQGALSISGNSASVTPIGNNAKSGSMANSSSNSNSNQNPTSIPTHTTSTSPTSTPTTTIITTCGTSTIYPWTDKGPTAISLYFDQGRIALNKNYYWLQSNAGVWSAGGNVQTLWRAAAKLPVNNIYPWTGNGPRTLLPKGSALLVINYGKYWIFNSDGSVAINPDGSYQYGSLSDVWGTQSTILVDNVGMLDSNGPNTVSLSKDGSRLIINQGKYWHMLNGVITSSGRLDDASAWKAAPLVGTNHPYSQNGPTTIYLKADSSRLIINNGDWWLLTGDGNWISQGSIEGTWGPSNVSYPQNIPGIVVNTTDCTTTDTPNIPVQAPALSPFGYHYDPSQLHSSDYMNDLGVYWSRPGHYLIWENIDKKDTQGQYGKYDFSVSDNQRMVQSAPAGMSVVINICPFAAFTTNTINAATASGFDYNRTTGEVVVNSKARQAYKNFVIKAVKRYNPTLDPTMGCTQPHTGDCSALNSSNCDCYSVGDMSYPSLPFITQQVTSPIRVWQVCNQISDASPCGTADPCAATNGSTFAEVQKLTYEAIKETDPNATVLMGGDDPYKEHYAYVYNALAQNYSGIYIDAIDFHGFFKSKGDYDPTDNFNALKASLAKAQSLNVLFDPSKLKFWITETGSYTRIASTTPPLKAQNETDQAAELVKRFVAAFGAGIERVFWTWGFEDGFGYSCGGFDFTGLIWGDPSSDALKSCPTYATLGPSTGAGNKKLGYYSFKLLVEKFANLNAANAITVVRSNGIYIFKFIDNQTGKSTWVAWNDSNTSYTKTVDLSAGVTSVAVTTAVPSFSAGSSIADYFSAFNSSKVNTATGQFGISPGIDGIPVYVQEN